MKGQTICKVFQQGGQKHKVLDQVDVDIYQGDFTVIMGSSGAGKSTLLYALSGMDTVTEGSVFYKEEEISRYSEKQMAALRAEEFGFVFQQTHLVSNLTLLENVAVAGYVSGKGSTGAIQKRAEKLLEQMRIKEVGGHLPSQVSGGEAQRAAIARAVIAGPGLIFADEPTGALNKANTQVILNLLSALNRNGQSILMVTHDLRAAIRGTRLLYLEDGRLMAQLKLPPYREAEARAREIRVNEWLPAQKW